MAIFKYTEYLAIPCKVSMMLLVKLLDTALSFFQRFVERLSIPFIQDTSDPICMFVVPLFLEAVLNSATHKVIIYSPKYITLTQVRFFFLDLLLHHVVHFIRVFWAKAPQYVG